MNNKPYAIDFMNVCSALYPFQKQLIEIKKAKDRDELLEVVYSIQSHEVISFDRNSEMFIKHDITNLSKKYLILSKVLNNIDMMTKRYEKLKIYAL